MSQRRGIGFGFWVVLLGLGGCTIAACSVAPDIGWTGWAVIVGIYLFGRHLEQQREILYELQHRNDQLDDGRRSWPPPGV